MKDTRKSLRYINGALALFSLSAVLIGIITVSELYKNGWVFNSSFCITFFGPIGILILMIYLLFEIREGWKKEIKIMILFIRKKQRKYPKARIFMNQIWRK